MRLCGAGVSRLVSDASNTIRHRVLHIRPQPPVSPGAGPDRFPIGELLASLPLETQWCGDVYRGLAILLRPSPESPQAAIVCLDGLGAPEFEFFSIVSKLRRDLKVYVYAAARPKSRIARAIELGAKGPVTREVLVELAGAPPIPMTVAAPARASEHVTDKLVSPVIAQHGHASVAHATPTSEPPRIGEEDARKPARVPWLRYGDRPVRVAPPHREPPLQPLNPNPQTLPRSYEPLLTEEELRALMSDDFAAIVGDDPQPEARPPSVPPYKGGRQGGRASTVPIDWPDDDKQIRGVP